MGRRAFLVDEVDDPAAWAAAFAAAAPDGVVDVVPAARTVLVVAADHESCARAARLVPGVDATGGSRPPGDEVVITVDYDGDDLGDVALRTGLSVAEIVAAHVGATYRVEFCGFAPGFAYLSGLPEQLRLPRRSTPRRRVPAGSVAIAAEWSAVYPTPSPGGWHLLGRTDAVLFDVDRPRPATLVPGTTVRFVAS